MLDIIKYLNKLDIQVESYDEKSITFIDKGVEKTFRLKELEQYLFICLTDYIKEA